MPRPQEIKRKKFDPDDNEYEYDFKFKQNNIQI